MVVAPRPRRRDQYRRPRKDSWRTTTLPDHPIPEGGDAICVRSRLGVVGHQNHGLAEGSRHLAQEPHQLFTGERIETSGRLVGEQQWGLGNDRPRHADALQFTSREFVRGVIQPLGKAQLGEQILGSLECPAPGHIGEHQRQGRVFDRGKGGTEVEILEHEADRCESKPSQSHLVEAIETMSPTRIRPAVGVSSPPISCNRVDLPAPLGPTTATNSPEATSNDTCLSTERS